MPWVKIDDAFLRHPKARAAGKDGRALFIAGLCWCATHGTDGRIEAYDLPVIAAEADVRPAATARRLVDVGLWEATDGGWLVHDYLDYNPSAAATEELRAKRAEAGRRGGQRSRPRTTTSEANREANASPDDPETEAFGEQNQNPVSRNPSTHSSPVVVNELTRDLDDDDLRAAIITARVERLGLTNRGPGWRRSVAASIDVRRARELANEGRTAAEIDLGLDQRHTPHTATPPPGPAQPAPWTPRIVPDAVGPVVGIERAASIRDLTRGRAIEA